MIRLKYWLFVFGLLFFISACSTVPVTGRKVLHLYSDAKLSKMAASQFKDLKKETPLSKDPQLNAKVNRVGRKIAAVAARDMPNAEWEFVVFDDADQINAFAMPGGKVAVYTGLFKVAKTSIALGNASDLVRSEATMSVSASSGDGVLEALDKLAPKFSEI